MGDARFEHFQHMADVGLRGYGSTPAEAFEQCGLALTDAVLDPSILDPHEPIEINCSAPDLETLLVDFLNEIIYAMATRRLVFGRFEVSIDGDNLHARAWGEPVDVKRHEPAAEPKGVTYTALKVNQQNGEWLAQCVVDV